MDPIGSLYVDVDGTAYRLRDYSVNWSAEPFTGEDEVPSFTILRVSGMSSTTRVLPHTVRLVWKP